MASNFLRLYARFIFLQNTNCKIIWFSNSLYQILVNLRKTMVVCWFWRSKNDIALRWPIFSIKYTSSWCPVILEMRTRSSSILLAKKTTFFKACVCNCWFEHIPRSITIRSSESLIKICKYLEVCWGSIILKNNKAINSNNNSHCRCLLLVLRRYRWDGQASR